MPGSAEVVAERLASRVKTIRHPLLLVLLPLGRSPAAMNRTDTTFTAKALVTTMSECRVERAPGA